MNDRRLVRVQIRQCVEELVGPEHHPADRKWFLRRFEPFCEILAGDVFHHQVLLFAFTKMIAYLRENRMSHSGQRSCFTLEGVTEHLITCKIRPLQGDSTSQTLVDGEINFSHSAFTDQMNDKIPIL